MMPDSTLNEQLPAWIRWMVERKRLMMYVAFALLLLLVGGYRLSSARSLRQKGDFYRAAEVVHMPVTAEAVERLQEVVKRNGALHSKYDGVLAQALLQQRQPKEAERYVRRTLKRTGQEAGETAAFARTSLLIAKGEYSKALALAAALQEQLDERPLLRAHNTMRIALLQQQLGNADEAQASWQALLTWLDADAPEGSTERIAAEQFAAAFHEGAISVREFVKAQLGNSR